MAHGLGYFGSDKQEQFIATTETEIFPLRYQLGMILSDVLILEVEFERKVED
jgi:hypothetical protein